MCTPAADAHKGRKRKAGTVMDGYNTDRCGRGTDMAAAGWWRGAVLSHELRRADGGAATRFVSCTSRAAFLGGTLGLAFGLSGAAHHRKRVVHRTVIACDFLGGDVALALHSVQGLRCLFQPRQHFVGGNLRHQAQYRDQNEVKAVKY
jgi:hypothetical protein